MMDNVFKINGKNIDADSLAGEIGQKQAKIELMTYNHFQQLKKICDKEQAKKLKSLFEGQIDKERRNIPFLGTPPPPPKP